MKINIITIFPDFFEASFAYSILKRAKEKKLIEVNIYNLRDWSKDRYKTIDDHPYGGGAGMIMMIQPIYDSLKFLNFPKNVVLPSAKGQVYNQSLAMKFSKLDEMTFIVPHFEGIDQRVIDEFVDFEVSVGPYILSGGELPVMSIIDSFTRLLPGVLGNPKSLEEESFNNYVEISNKDVYLEYDQYTRPQSFVLDNGKILAVPDVLVSGNHKDILNWKKGIK